MKKHLKRLLGQGKRIKDIAQDRLGKPAAEADDVRITNETVAARREEVLGSARRFIYPLDAPRHRVIKFSVAIAVVAVVSFFVFCLLELYRFQSTSAFMYGVTQVVPFPVAIIDHRYPVAYNDYLFELRHYVHYYETQARTDFATKDGQQQLTVFKHRSLDQALQNAYVSRLAQKNDISVSDQEVDAAVALVRSQNRLGASDQVFRSVINEYWGWSVDDFRRELRNELLAQKVVDKLDIGTHSRAAQALTKLRQGTDFAELAKEVSDDQGTKGNGGDYGTLIDRTNVQLPPQVVDAIFKLDNGQISDIVNTGYSLEIIKVTQVQGAQRRASHISFAFQPVATYTKALETSERPWTLIHF